MDVNSWLMNQAPAIVILSAILYILWKQYIKVLADSDLTIQWRTEVRQHLADIDAALIQQSSRIGTVEYLVGLQRGKKLLDRPELTEKPSN